MTRIQHFSLQAKQKNADIEKARQTKHRVEEVVAEKDRELKRVNREMKKLDDRISGMVGVLLFYSFFA